MFRSPCSARINTSWIVVALLSAAACATRFVPAAEPAANGSDQNSFPTELVKFVPCAPKPVFAPLGEGTWEVKLRERGWILREGALYRLWYTGYDGTRDGQKLLGYATSRDGIEWTRHPENPIYREHWIEDMMVLKQDGLYYMFAEGLHDQAQWLTSRDGLRWERRGQLDVRNTRGEPLTPGPFGTPTVWYEAKDKTWNLFYERSDQGVWLARSSDLKSWKNVQDEPVLARGPAAYDREMIALNQIIKKDGRYYAYYHGTGTPAAPRLWTTNVAVSTDLVHWTKYSGNPLLPEAANKSSGLLIDTGDRFRLFTMHDVVEVHCPPKKTDECGE